MSPTLTLVIVGIAALIVGYLFGMIDAKVTANIRKKDEEKEKAADIQVVEKVVEKPVEVRVPFSVLLDEQLRPTVKLAGEIIDPRTITPEQRAKLIDIISKIRPWIDPRVAPTSAAAPTPAPAAPPVESPVAMTPPMSTPPVAPLRPVVSSTQEPGIKVPNILQSASAYMQAAVVGKGVEKKPMTIVEQIDAVIQERLEYSPYAGQKIALLQGPNMEVIVTIGLQRYSGIDSVPDPGIKAFIAECRDIWSKNQR